MNNKITRAQLTKTAKDMLVKLESSFNFFEDDVRTFNLADAGVILLNLIANEKFPLTSFEQMHEVGISLEAIVMTHIGIVAGIRFATDSQSNEFESDVKFV